VLDSFRNSRFRFKELMVSMMVKREFGTAERGKP
jgi:hypothetical protein